MTLPSFLLGAVLASLLGSAFHLWRGGGVGRFFAYMILAWLGFWGGHFAANLAGWEFARLGPLNLGTALFFSALLLLGSHWLGAASFPLEEE